MNVTEGIRMAMRSLAANKMRAGLTMLGIIIGTGAVIALLSVGQGAQAAITEQIEGIGSNLIFVFAGRLEQSMGQTQIRTAQPLTRQDANAIMEPGRADHVAAVAPEVNRSGNLTYNGANITTNVIGTTPEYEYVRNFRPAIGQFFTASDESAAARVVVLGSQAAEVLFGDPQLAVGESVRINRVPFTVVGVLESKGGQGFAGGSQDNIAIVPLTTAQRRLYSGRFASSSGERVDLINISAIDDKSVEAAINEITWVLRERHDIEFDEDDFTVASQEDILGVLGQITSILTIFLGAIAGISLLVGGIGIMNIMLVSVTERTREIGIRKAVGAKRRDILGQFLIESVALSVFGGAIGIAFGWGISRIINTLGVFTTVVSPQAVLLAVGFSIAVGLFFGIYPANRASNLNPIQALRYE
ncbi:MAG: FtsX-like permease family protein [Chloroflexi bacterium]|nr:FtsX-like permease family protein [Chloroflexota bacterium]